MFVSSLVSVVFVWENMVWFGVSGSTRGTPSNSREWCVGVKCVAVAECCLVEQVVCVCVWCDYLICFVLGIVCFSLFSYVMCA